MKLRACSNTHLKERMPPAAKWWLEAAPYCSDPAGTDGRLQVPTMPTSRMQPSQVPQLYCIPK